MGTKFYLRCATTLHNHSDDTYSIEISNDIKDLLDEDSLRYELETSEDVCFYICQLNGVMKLLFKISPQDEDDELMVYELDTKRETPLSELNDEFLSPSAEIFEELEDENLFICLLCNFCFPDKKQCINCGNDEIIDIQLGERINIC